MGDRRSRATDPGHEPHHGYTPGGLCGRGGGQRGRLAVGRDWLCVPYAQAGLVQSLGETPHALVLDMDLGEEVEIKNIELECLSNEVLVGLLGVTVI